jgi:hypothetical protein
MISSKLHFILGIFLCLSGFLLTLSSLSITVYNFEHSDDNNLRFERTVIQLIAQLCIIIGFGFIYYDVIKRMKKQ